MVTQNQQKIIKKIISTLKFSGQNGAIILLACDEEKIRKEVEKCLQQEFITPISIHLQEERNNLPAILRKDLQDNAICQVYNLPEVIRAEEAKEPDRVAACLQYLNSDREVFFEKKVAAIFWLDEDTLNKKITWQATDFWSYRTMSAVFKSEEIPKRRGQKQKDWLQMVSDKQNLLQEYRHKRPNDKASIAVVLSDMAWALYQTEKLDEALLQYQEALKIDREIGDRQCEAIRLGNIGVVYLDLEQTEEALISHQEALKIDQELGYRQNEAIQLSSIGMVYERLGRIEEALEHHQEALKINQELGYRQGEAIQLSSIGMVYQNSGKLQDALEYHQKALNIFQELGYTQDQADQLEEISRIYQNSGQTEDALKYHQQALEIMGVQIDAETEKKAQAAVKLIERQIIPDEDTPVSEYIPQQVSTELPVVRFPGELKRFAEAADIALWQNLTCDERYFLSNLAVKLEPIIQIVPSPPIPFVLGFELLALGPNGENFPEVINRTGFDPGLVRLMLAIVALKTAETLRADATFGGQPGARNLLFTINLDPEMLESPHLTTFMNVYNSPLHDVVFEINEDTSLKHIDRIKELVIA
ncbi:MAG: tetratricopeptide repeat protein, partial [Candidatus Desantisbacteria bacterium]